MVQLNRSSPANTPHGRQCRETVSTLAARHLQDSSERHAKKTQGLRVRARIMVSSSTATSSCGLVDWFQRDRTPDRVTIGTERGEHTNTKESAMDPSRCLMSQNSGSERVVSDSTPSGSQVMRTCVSQRQGLASSRLSSKSRKVGLCAGYGGDAAGCGWNLGVMRSTPRLTVASFLFAAALPATLLSWHDICCAFLCQDADNGVQFPPLRTCQPGHRWNFNGADNEIRAAPKSWIGPIKRVFVPDGAMAANTVQMMHDDDPIATPFQQRSGAANQPNENNLRTSARIGRTAA